MTAEKPALGVRGRPNPGALRRTGVQLKLLLPPGENEEAKRDAAQREMSLAGHVRDLLRQWRASRAGAPIARQWGRASRRGIAGQ